MVAYTQCPDKWENRVHSAMGGLKAAHVLFGKSLPLEHALPAIFGAWLNIQRSLACIANEDSVRNSSTLDGDFLSRFCSVSSDEFLALNSLHAQFEKSEQCVVKRKLIRRHVAVLRKMTISMQYLKDARISSRAGIGKLQTHVRLIAVTILLLVGAAGGILFANAPSPNQGIHASYFKDDDFKKCYRSRIDENIDHNWKKSSPMKGIPVDHFSVIWDGWVIIKKGELKRFSADADDTMRVYIDGSPAIINDGPQRFREVTSEKIFGPGRHRIKVIFKEHRGRARARLRWNTNNGYWSPVPSSRLRPSN